LNTHNYGPRGTAIYAHRTAALDLLSCVLILNTNQWRYATPAVASLQ